MQNDWRINGVRSKVPETLEPLLWEYAKALQKPEGLCEPHSGDEPTQEWYSYTRGIFDAKNALSKELNNGQRSRRLTPVAVLVDDTIVPWYELHKFDASLVIEWHLHLAYDTTVSITQACARLQGFGIIFTPEQNTLIREEIARESANMIRPRTQPSNNSHLRVVRPKPEPKQKTAKVVLPPITKNALIEKLKAKGLLPKEFEG